MTRIHACGTAKGVLDIDPDRLLYKTVANFGKVDVNFRKLKKLVEVDKAPRKESLIKKQVFWTSLALQRLSLIARYTLRTTTLLQTSGTGGQI